MCRTVGDVNRRQNNRIATERLKHQLCYAAPTYTSQTDPNRDRAIETGGSPRIAAQLSDRPESRPSD